MLVLSCVLIYITSCNTAQAMGMFSSGAIRQCVEYRQSVL